MITKREFGILLSDHLLRGASVNDVSRWAHSLYLERGREFEPEVGDLVMKLIAMDEGPEFQYSREELVEMAGELAGS